jgi:hypothetical protein
MRNESFNRSVEAITHDSDPKYLRFVEFDRNNDPPTEVIFNTGNLGEANNPATPASGAIVGPKIADLTGGIALGAPLTIGDLSDGTTHAILSFLGGTTIESDITCSGGEGINTLAVVQGKDGLTDGTLSYIGTSLDLSSAVGKTLDSITLTNTVPYGPAGLDKAATTFKPKISGSSPIGLHQLLDGNSTTFGSLGIVIAGGDDFRLRIQMVGTQTSHPNAVTLTIEPPCTLAGLDAGSVSIVFTTDDSGTYAFPLLYSNLQAHGVGIGVQKYSATSFQLGWDLSPLIGKTILFVSIAGTIPWHESGPFDLGTSSHIDIVYNLDQSNPAVWPGAKMLNPFVGIDIPTVGALPYDGTFNFNIVLQLRSSFNFNASLPVAATNILASLSGPELTEFQHLNSPPLPITTFDFSAIHDYVITAASFDAATSYGMVGATVNSKLQLILQMADDNNQQHPVGMIHGVTMGTNDAAVPPFDPVLITGNADLGMYFDLYPHSTPDLLPLLLFTEPYELRHRNLPAFRFYFTYGGQQEGALLNVKMFVSQGKVDTSPQEWLWTPCPVDVLDNTTALKEQAFAHLDIVDEGITGLSAEYGGSMLIVPKEYTGPWNYIKFLLYTPDGQDVSVLNAGIVNILANAREVI